MEPASKIYGVHYSDEECQSSESGWTMYLGSRVDGENDHQNHSDAYQYDGKTHGYDHKDDSDDSMVSDASSGPSTHQKARAARVAEQEEKAKTKKHSAASATAKTRKEYNKPAEKKAKVKSSKAN